MLIGIDFDGVIANTNYVKSKLANKLGYGLFAPSIGARTFFIQKIGIDKYNEISSIVYSPEVTKKIQPVRGAIEYIRRLRQVGVGIVIITAREGESLKASKQWLTDRLDLPIPKIISSNS